MQMDTLSNELMAAVAVASCRPDTARKMADRIETSLRHRGELLSPEKKLALEETVSWLRLCALGGAARA